MAALKSFILEKLEFLKKHVQKLVDSYKSSEKNFAHSRLYKQQIRYLKEEHIMKSNIILVPY